jgi:hypothetical protein
VAARAARVDVSTPRVAALLSAGEPLTWSELNLSMLSLSSPLLVGLFPIQSDLLPNPRDGFHLSDIAFSVALNDPLSLVKQKEVRKMLRALEEGK